MERKAPLLAIKVTSNSFCSLLFVCMSFITSRAQSQPTIATFFPTKGNVGSVITITGTNFDPQPSNNVVYFGPVKASVISATETSVTVWVPPHSTYSPLSITVAGLTAYSKTAFTVTNDAIANEAVSTNSYTSGLSYPSIASTNNLTSVKSTTNTIEVADFDNDDKPDVVKGGTTGNLKVHRNTNTTVGAISNLTFDNGTDFTIDGACWSLVTADFDGDGKKDIASVSDNTVSFLRNSSTGVGSINFDTAVNLTTSNTSKIQAADIDGDGKIDIIVSNGASDNFKVYLNQSTVGTLSFSSSYTQTSGIGQSSNILVGDINNDGKPDLLAFGGKLSLFINSSTSNNVTFLPAVTLSSNEYYGTIIDIDGDGDNDIVGNTNLIQNNIQDSTSITGSSFTNYSVGTHQYSKITAGDFNGDGKTDIVSKFNKESTNKLIFIKNNNDLGVFTDSLLSQYSVPGNAFGNLILCDMDGDNKMDIITAEGENAYFNLYRNFIGEEPVINTQGALGLFSKCHDENSATQTIVVSGIRLIDGLHIDVPFGFEISLDNANWTTSITLTPIAGTVSNTILYLRATRNNGTINNQLLLYSDTATSIAIPLSTDEIIVEAPTPVTSVNYCQNSVANPLTTATTAGNQLRWYDSLPSQTLLSSAPTPNTSEIGVTTYFVSQYNSTSGCESEKIAITITVNAIPVAETITPNNTTLCKNTIQMLTTEGGNATWSPINNLYTDSSATIAYTGTPTAVVYAKGIATTNYTAAFSNDTSCAATATCQLTVISSEGGTATGGGTYTANAPSLQLSVLNYTGNVIRWEKSVSPYTTWTAITNSASEVYFPGLFSVNTRFRAVVQNGSCPVAYSTSTQVIINNTNSDYFTTIRNSFWNTMVTPSTIITYQPISLPAGSTITKYKVEVTNTVLNTVAEYESTAAKFRIMDLPTTVATYNCTFSIRVSLQINGVWNAYGTSKSVLIGTITAPVLTTYCNQLLPSINKVITCTAIPLTTFYVFEITRIANGEPLEMTTYNTTKNSFSLIDLPYNTFPVFYNASYTVRVKVKYLYNGAETESDFGSSCTINTPNTQPVISMISGCGAVPSKSTLIKCSTATGATAYMFQLTNSSQSFQIVTTVSRFTIAMVPNISPNTTYTVTPLVKVYGQYYAGNPCEITTPSVVAKTSKQENEELAPSNTFKAIAYPNPFQGNFKLKLDSQMSDTITIKVFDILGNQLENKTSTPSDLDYLELGDAYASGIYHIIITQNNNNQIIKIMKK